MKNTILTLLFAAASITGASAGLQALVSPASSTPVATGYSATVTVAATEVVEFHSFLSTGNSSAVIHFTVGGKTFSHALYEPVGQHYPGPLTFRLFSSTTAFGGLVNYRIVDASVYAKNQQAPAGKDQFMAAMAGVRRTPSPMVLPAETAAN